ncbi:MAG: PIG-L family deacetylase [Planctomycetales bacterium]|nr:PIG-L family deacetylase [Planctomycetales bacterium]
MNTAENCRVLVFGAHPDDAEIFAGGLIARQCNRGACVRIISVTDGRSGHHEVAPEVLIGLRRLEAARAGKSVGAQAYLTWDFPDGSLVPDLILRQAIIREIREFQPHIVLTHRTNDYHPDHRAVGTAVQDASYMVTVPHVCPESPALKFDPVVAYMCDLFTRPCKFRPDIVLLTAEEGRQVVDMVACHASQVFQWLPFHDGLMDQLPNDYSARLVWLEGWLRGLHMLRHEHFSNELQRLGVTAAAGPIELYEVSEYAGRMHSDHREWLFPGAIT